MTERKALEIVLDMARDHIQCNPGDTEGLEAIQIIEDAFPDMILEE
tara:strand:+ start:109 stop:246 length:138 start_codon:yes stop_codon:yes gene_type:complete